MIIKTCKEVLGLHPEFIWGAFFFIWVIGVLILGLIGEIKYEDKKWHQKNKW